MKNRIEKIYNQYYQQLKGKKNKNIFVFIQSIIDSDITKGKYVRFLIEAFLNNKFLEEDLIGGLNSTVGQAISLFDKHKSKLPEDMRSVFKYSSPGDLWKAVKQFEGELSGKELKKEEQEKIYRETEFVYKDEKTGFQIVSPLTEESAKWWGKGTRWCTSAENNNQFLNYEQKAPLFILLMPNGDKLQLWKYKNGIQFMDETDNKVSLEYIEQNWNILKSICLWFQCINYIPQKYQTRELCELAIKHGDMALPFIAEHFKTKELCELAVKKNGWSLEYVPEEYKTSELCKLAVKQSGWALSFVPYKLRTKELCELAIRQNGMALKFVPDELRTEKLYKMAVNRTGVALKFVPKHLITKELCELAVKQNGRAFKYIPKELKTKEFCKLIVQKNKFVFKYMSDDFMPDSHKYISI